MNAPPVSTRPPQTWGHPLWLRAAPIVPALFVVMIAAMPMAALLFRILDPNVVRALAEPSLWGVAFAACLQAAASAGVALLWGVPLAGLVTRYEFPGRRALLALTTVPFVLPTVVVALAISAIPGVNLIGDGLALVVIAHAYINIAVVIRVVGARWSSLDPRQLAVARTLGAAGSRIWRTITLPHLAGSIATAFAISFTFCFTSLGIVLFLGDSSTRTLETTILRNTSVILNFPAAIAAALLQFVVVGALVLAVTRSSHITDAPIDAARITLRSSRHRVVLIGFTATSTALIAIPLMAIAVASVRASQGWTLQWWMDLFSPDGASVSLLRSLTLAAVTAAIAAVVGLAAALGSLTHRYGRVVAVIAVLPLGISAVTIGLGTVLAYGRPPIDLRSLGVLLPLAHSLIAVPLVLAVSVPALRSVDSRMVAVAASLGASPTRAFFTAYRPVLVRVAVASAGLAAAVSLGEFGAASFLANAQTPTAPVLIGRLLTRPGEGAFGVAAALSAALAVMTWAAVALLDRRRT